MLSRSPPRVGIGFPCPPLTIFRDLVRFLRQRHRCDFGAGEFQPLGWPRDHPVPYNGRKPVIRNCLYGTLPFFPAGAWTADILLLIARKRRLLPRAPCGPHFLFPRTTTGLIQSPVQSNVNCAGSEFISQAGQHVWVGFPCPPSPSFGDVFRFLRQRHRCESVRRGISASRVASRPPRPL